MAQLEFDFEWRITLFTLVLLPLLISLGFWQLEREDEKRALAQAFERQQAQPPAPLSSLLGQRPQELAYRPVALRGRYLSGKDLLLSYLLKYRSPSSKGRQKQNLVIAK